MIVDALDKVIGKTNMVIYEPGESIFQEGSDADVLFIIRDGRVKLLNYVENGRARITRLLTRGSIAGLNGLMDEPHTNTAIAVSRVSVYHVPMSALQGMKDRNSLLYSDFMEQWYEFLNEADTWITEFSTGAIKGRVARLIRYLAEFDDSESVGNVELLTVEEMAEILGITAESVSRTMAEFKRKGVLTPDQGKAPNRFDCDMPAINDLSEN